jgi:Beta-propeller repeat
MRTKSGLIFLTLLAGLILLISCQFQNDGDDPAYAKVEFQLETSRDPPSSRNSIPASFSQAGSSVVIAVPGSVTSAIQAWAQYFDASMANVAAQTVSLTLPYATSIRLVKLDFTDVLTTTTEAQSNSPSAIDNGISQPFTISSATTSQTVVIDMQQVTDSTTDASGDATGDATTDTEYTVLTWLGTRQAGTTSTDHGHHMVMDLSGDIFLVGHSDGSWGGETTNGTDIALSRFYNSGEFKSVKFLGNAASNNGTWLAPDHLGNIYICGHTSGSLPLDSTSFTLDPQIFLAKYNNSGVVQWVSAVGANAAAGNEAIKVAVDSSGSIYVVDVESGLHKYSSADGSIVGSAVYPVRAPYDMNDFLYAMVTDASDNVYIAYHDYDNGGVVFQEHILKYSSSLTLVHDLTGDIYTGPDGLFVDSGGNIYTTGYTEGSLDGSNAGGRDIYVKKYNSSYSLVWVKQLGSSATDEGRDVIVDSSGNVYVSGMTQGTLPGQTAPTGTYDMVLIKYNSSGVKQWHLQFGPTSYYGGENILLDRLGGIYVSGTATATIDGAPNASDGTEDLFLIKFDTDGNRLCSGGTTCP